MNPELEALIRAYDEYLNAEKTAPERDLLWEKYQKLLISSADRERVSRDILHKAVQQRHFLWPDRAKSAIEFAAKGLIGYFAIATSIVSSFRCC